LIAFPALSLTVTLLTLTAVMLDSEGTPALKL
jgi:hypothetical protein